MSENKSPEEIEREIEVERGALARSLEELQTQLSPDALMESATGYMRTHGSPVAQNMARQLRENPVAAAITGVGIGWLIVGSSRKPPSYDRWAETHDGSLPDPGIETDGSGRVPMAARYGTFGGTEPSRPAIRPTAPRPAYDPTPYEPVSGFREARDPMAGFDDRLANASRAYYDIEDHDDDGVSWWETVRDRGDEWFETMRDQIGVWSEKALDSLPTVHRDKLREGTETMSDTARLRVMQARQAAYDAQAAFDQRRRQYSRSGRDAYHEQPLVGGLIAFGIGAALGAMLPRTRSEDEYFGVYRDRAMDEAERIFSTEKERLTSVAQAAAQEAKNVATEALNEAKGDAPSGKEAVAKVEGAAKSAGERVKDAAQKEAERQDLGGSVRS